MCGAGGAVAGGAGGAGRCCVCAHSRRASPLTCLAVCFLVLTYNLLGGFLFLALEGASDSETAVAASTPQLGPPTELRARTVERLWSITEDLNILYKENWTKLAAKELLDFQTVLLKTLRAPGSRGPPAPPAPPGVRGVHPDHDYRWTFSTSFLYALTLITTIGHGNVTPKSAAGKLVALGYACVGIPLIMLYLATMGGALARRVRALYARLRPRRPRRPRLKPPPSAAGPGAEGRTPFQAALNLDALPPPHWACRDHARVPVLISLLFMALYVALGSVLFHATERWSLLDGCYFSFSSLATIGFGELRPGLHAGAVSGRAEDVAVGVCCIYILVGIVVVAMCFNLIQEELGEALRGVAGLCARGAVHSARGPRAAGAAAGREKPPAVAS